MQIGIISDTHSFLDPRVFEAFEHCDEIWHAGDFGNLEVAQQLADFKPLKGVYGNIDDSALRLQYPENLRFECGGVDVLDDTHCRSAGTLSGAGQTFARRVNAGRVDLRSLSRRPSRK